MRDRAVERIAAAETELADAHDLLERCDTALDLTPRGNPDSILEIARRAGASDPVLVREADGLRLTIGPVDDPVAIGRAIIEREPVTGSALPFLGSRQVLIAPGIAFRFERRPGVQLPLGPLPPLSTVGALGNRGAL